MAALSVFRQVGKIADSEFLAMDVLPILWSFALGPLLNLQQFKEYMDLVKGLSSKIEQEQTRKLRDLVSTAPNGSSLLQQPSNLMSTGTSYDPFSPTNSTSDSDFEHLVLGKSSSSPMTSDTANMDQFTHLGNLTSHSFSWSSNPWPTTASVSSRVVTPDTSYTLPSFGKAPQPTTSLQQPLQPTVSALNTWASPPQTGVPANSIHPTNIWQSPQQFQQLGTVSGDLPLRPTLAQPQQQNMGMSNPGGFSQVLQPVQKASAWGVSPPQPPGAGLAFQGQQQPVRKTGLDAYESLI